MKHVSRQAKSVSTVEAGRVGPKESCKKEAFHINPMETPDQTASLTPGTDAPRSTAGDPFGLAWENALPHATLACSCDKDCPNNANESTCEVYLMAPVEGNC